MKSFKHQKGFTLIELLVVIGILAVLLAITLVAINPAKQFAQANNAKRRSDVLTLLNAVDQYMADHKGIVPVGITESEQPIADMNGTGANICAVLVPTYVAALPVDPKTNDGAAIADCTNSYTTGYTILQSASSNRITVSAPATELDESISVTR